MCAYCERGAPASGPGLVLCPKKGVVAEDFSCRSFVYAPTKRIPRRQRALPSFSREDFSL